MSHIIEIGVNGTSTILNLRGVIKQYDRGPNGELLPTKRWPGLEPLYAQFDDLLKAAEEILDEALASGVALNALREGIDRLKDYIDKGLDTL